MVTVMVGEKREMVGEKREMVGVGAAAELERRSRYLSGLIQQQRRQNNNAHGKATEREAPRGPEEEEAEAPRKQVVVVVKGRKEAASDRAEVVLEPPEGQGRGGAGRGRGAGFRKEQPPRLVRVRAADMAPELQKRAFRCAGEAIAGMKKLDSKRLALALKKEFDSSYGPAWHCIVGTSFGSYVTHSLGGFLYFSIDKVYILLFKTAVQPLKND